MSDICCAVCGEPYDAWGVTHGDMLRWEAILFKQGAGCPSCEGSVSNEEPLSDLAGIPDRHELDSLHHRLLEDTDEDGDPDLLFRLMSDGGNHNRPKWEPPPEEVLWECSGCHVKVIVDHDNDYPDGPLNVPTKDKPRTYSGGDKVHGSHGALYTYNDVCEKINPATEKAPFEVEGKPYCDACCQTCAECDSVIFSRSELEFGDPYASGSSFLPSGKYLSIHALCIDCYEQLCPECGAGPNEECTCEHPKEEEVP